MASEPIVVLTRTIAVGAGQLPQLPCLGAEALLGRKRSQGHGCGIVEQNGPKTGPLRST